MKIKSKARALQKEQQKAESEKLKQIEKDILEEKARIAAIPLLDLSDHGEKEYLIRLAAFSEYRPEYFADELDRMSFENIRQKLDSFVSSGKEHQVKWF